MLSQTRHIFFIDARVADYSNLIDALPAESGLCWMRSRTATQRCNRLWLATAGLDSIHGTPIMLYLGRSKLQLRTPSSVTWALPVRRARLGSSSAEHDANDRIDFDTPTAR